MFEKNQTFAQYEPYGFTHEQAKKFHELAVWREKHYSGENDPLRILNFVRLVNEVNQLPDGDYIEMGTQYGGSARFIWELMLKDKKLYCFDTFKGFPQEDLDVESEHRANHGWTTESIRGLPAESVRELILEGEETDRLTLVPGRVPISLKPYGKLRWRFAHLDMDLYEPTKGAMKWLWPRMVPGGLFVFHDYDALSTVKLAVDEFLAPHGLLAIPLNDRFGSAVSFKPLAKARKSAAKTD